MYTHARTQIMFVPCFEAQCTNFVLVIIKYAVYLRNVVFTAVAINHYKQCFQSVIYFILFINGLLCSYVSSAYNKKYFQGECLIVQ